MFESGKFDKNAYLTLLPFDTSFCLQFRHPPFGFERSSIWQQLTFDTSTIWQLRPLDNNKTWHSILASKFCWEIGNLIQKPYWQKNLIDKDTIWQLRHVAKFCLPNRIDDLCFSLHPYSMTYTHNTVTAIQEDSKSKTRKAAKGWFIILTCLAHIMKAFF